MASGRDLTQGFSALMFGVGVIDAHFGPFGFPSGVSNTVVFPKLRGCQDTIARREGQ